MNLLSIDPSIRSVGVAFFETKLGFPGALRWSGRVLVESTGEPVMRCVQMAAKIVQTIRGERLEPDALIFEWPQIYTAAKSKGDPNDLIYMAGVGTALAVALSGKLSAVHSPQPGDWTRIPKACPKCHRSPGPKSCPMCRGSAWRTPRGALIAESLTDGERFKVNDQHDEIDSVGLGLWKLGRLATRRVFPGAV